MIAKVIPLPTTTEIAAPEPTTERDHEEDLREIDQLVNEVDPKAKESERFAMRLLIASAMYGPNVKRLAKFLRVPRSRIAPMARRLRDSGVWVGSRIYHSGWDDEETGNVALILDALTALGLVKRA